MLLILFSLLFAAGRGMPPPGCLGEYLHRQFDPYAAHSLVTMHGKQRRQRRKRWWLGLVDDLQKQIKNTNVTQQVIQFISELSSKMIGILDYYEITKVTTMHQKSISDLYSTIFNHIWSDGIAEPITQSTLILLIQMMMDQNIKMNISLEVSVWNTFFAIYYSIYHQLPDNSIYAFLSDMAKDGSKTKPDTTTFNIILVGIATNKAIEDPQKLSNAVLNIMTTQYNITASPHFFPLIFQMSKHQHKENWVIHRKLYLPNEQTDLSFGIS